MHSKTRQLQGVKMNNSQNAFSCVLNANEKENKTKRKKMLPFPTPRCTKHTNTLTRPLTRAPLSKGTHKHMPGEHTPAGRKG